MNNINFQYIVNCIKLFDCYLSCTPLKNIFKRHRN